jgi:hypothetical protein
MVCKVVAVGFNWGKSKETDTPHGAIKISKEEVSNLFEGAFPEFCERFTNFYSDDGAYSALLLTTVKSNSHHHV